MLRLAANEIEELKDGLKYAEYMLARTKQEKEDVQKQVEQHD